MINVLAGIRKYWWENFAKIDKCTGTTIPDSRVSKGNNFKRLHIKRLYLMLKSHAKRQISRYILSLCPQKIGGARAPLEPQFPRPCAVPISNIHSWGALDY